MSLLYYCLVFKEKGIEYLTDFCRTFACFAARCVLNARSFFLRISDRSFRSLTELDCADTSQLGIYCVRKRNKVLRTE